MLPEPLYPQKEIGIFAGKSALETLLEKAQVRYEDFILWCEATKVSTPKSINILGDNFVQQSSTRPGTSKEVYLILQITGFSTLRKSDDKITRYSYMEVSSIPSKL